MLEALLTVPGIILVFIIANIVVGYFLSAPKYSGPVTDHFEGKRFINPGNARAKGFLSVFRWVFTRQPAKWVFMNVPFGEKPIERIENGLRITWINHSTFLIQVDGLNIITDPIWSERASPFSWAGPKRFRPPGIRFDDLPQIDIVLLSHNHYDHLHIETLQKLDEKFHAEIFTSLGVKAFLKEKKIDAEIIEMDWWNEQELSDRLKLTSVPAQHFSGRGMFDRDATLWSGFVIGREQGNIYFAADTGYNDSTFKEIGNRLSPVSLAIIPIGAYKPRWFMSPIHTSPEESVKIHLDVKSQKSIASHFGTFPLGDEGRDEAINELSAAIKKFKLSPGEFVAIDEGTAFQF
ncbi:MAG: MBL fold metallo-hydrolase [Chitinophagales bacterium]